MPEKKTGSGGAPGEEPATKQAVYDAAVRLFARNGFAATGMRELSREAGVNLATVNYFYGSKKGLLKAILEDYFAGLEAVLRANLDGVGAPDAKLKRLVAALARYFNSVSDKLIIALTELPHDDLDITEFKAQRFRRLSGLFQDNLAGPGEQIPVAFLVPAIVGLTASRFLLLPVLRQALPPGASALDFEGYPEMVAELFINGFNGLLANNPGGQDA
jgi:AcrR family transcriptional regulator